MKLRCVLLLALILPTLASVAEDEDRPLALSVEVQQLGRGAEHTVVGIVVQVAPEDRSQIGERARILITLLNGEKIVDRHAAVVSVSAEGSAMLYREWPPGSYELQVGLAAAEGTSSGVWFGDIEIAEAAEPFVAPADAPPDAVALELTPPRQGVVRFLPPPDIGGIGAIQLEVEAPEATASVEFFQGDRSLGRRNRPPWTVSVPLGDIVRRTMVRAIASDRQGHFLGEDAVVLNNPTGQIGVEILLAPESSVRDGKRTVTVSVTGAKQIQQVTLTADDQQLARWAECPCVAEVDATLLARANILAADVLDAGGSRGDVVLALAGGGGFVGSVQVELVELPVVVLDDRDLPVVGLAQSDFTVYEDGQKVEVEGFGSTADLPLSLAIAVDTSGSMVEEFDDVRQALRGFADGLLEEDDSVVLIRFAWDATVEVAWTEDVRQISGRVDRLQPEGGTSLHDAVVRSLEQFRGRRGRQAVVLLTDGEDTTSRTGWSVAERFAHTMRVPIFPIGLGLGSLGFNSRGVLKSLAAETGGEAFFPKNVDELPAVYARIAELLRSQYLLWYPSPSSKPFEEFREITVEVSKPGLKVQTIRGYYPGK